LTLVKTTTSGPTGTDPRSGEDAMPRAEVVASELQEMLRLGVKESPLLTLAAAGAVGYVLGGGLTLGVLARLVGVGVRAAVALRAQQAISDWLGMEERSKNERQAS
jgi:hypothetical protein